MHWFAVFFFATGLAVKQDQTPLRAGCEIHDETVAALPAGSPIEIRFAMTGAVETCYKVSATVGGKPVQGYLPASALSGLDEFENGRQSAPAIEVSREVQKAIAPSPEIAGAPDQLLEKASALLQEHRPGPAREMVEKAMRVTGREYSYLVLAGLAAYQGDDVKAALTYLKEADQMKPDLSVERMIAKLEKEMGGDRSGDKLFGNRFLLRYEGGVLDTDVARTMVSILEDEYSRISNVLGCRTDDRIVTIVQSLKAYRASTDAAEWSGGQFDGKIRIPVIEAKSITAATRKALAHEVVHACLASMGSWPAWLHEGMAQRLSGDTQSASVKRLVKNALRDGILPKLENMSQSWSRMSPQHAAMAYGYALTAVDLMMEQYKAYGIQNILRNPERLPQITAELDKSLIQ
jgi:hypothetical protein